MYCQPLEFPKNHKSLYPHGVLFGSNCPDGFLGVNIITEPVAMRAYLVAFDLFDGPKHIERIGVVLPGWTHDPTPLYSYLESVEGQDINIGFERISDELDFIVDAPLAALQHWNERFAKDDAPEQESQGQDDGDK